MVSVGGFCASPSVDPGAWCRMRVLWISCLLVGSITCFPQQGGSGVPSPMWLPRSGQAPSKPGYEEPSEQTGGHDSSSSFPWLYSSNTAGGPSDSGIFQPMWYPVMPSGQESSKPSHQKPTGQSSTYGSYSGPYTAGGAYSSSGSQQYGAPSSQSGGAEQESWSSSSDGDDEDEPVFTPVSEEDQVYAFKSRSRYNQKRLLFSQFRYTPTEPRQDPVFPHTGKTSQHGKGPVKGGY
ncbi:uncharacterized protein LOC112150349 isoform X2 [Oryzias melastigma]|uniref:uncharacterized protein LOC112150349 isoform X2 n=1 Tax=Oryzias melastigma TaxID=30732 RepID=UPI00168CC919|nr:uncharacterized protein LOC112150349 isoform X2 [Oryzias melastigma]